MLVERILTKETFQFFTIMMIVEEQFVRTKSLKNIIRFNKVENEIRKGVLKNIDSYMWFDSKLI